MCGRADDPTTYGGDERRVEWRHVRARDHAPVAVEIVDMWDGWRRTTICDQCGERLRAVILDRAAVDA